MRVMADLVRRSRYADEIMQIDLSFAEPSEN